MPLHDYQCHLGHVTERMLPAGVDTTRCDTCGLEANKVFLTPPLVRGDLPGYVSPVSGEWIEGRRAREEDLRRTGCRPYDEGEKEAAERHRAREEREFDKRLDETIDSTIQGWDARKRERLQSEMDAGVDAVVARTTPDVSQLTQ